MILAGNMAYESMGFKTFGFAGVDVKISGILRKIFIGVQKKTG
jgi:catalase (peroxidase I)